MHPLRLDRLSLQPIPYLRLRGAAHSPGFHGDPLEITRQQWLLFFPAEEALRERAWREAELTGDTVETEAPDPIVGT